MTSAAELDLGAIWLFSTCSATQLRAIRRAADLVDVPQDQTLCTEGTEGSEFSLIVEGTAAVRRRGRTVARLGPGQYFGELSLLDHRPRSASVVSTSPMRLLVLSQDRFEALLQRTPAMAIKLMAAMAARLRAADTKVFG